MIVMDVSEHTSRHLVLCDAPCAKMHVKKGDRIDEHVVSVVTQSKASTGLIGRET